jgi:hypothetical protein
MSNDPKRKLEIGHVYGLYDFTHHGTCKKCDATSSKLNKVGHCESCQDKLDAAAGVLPRQK